MRTWLYICSRTPPPKEIYALHRKLSGAIVTCTKLKVSQSLLPCQAHIHPPLQAGVAADIWANFSLRGEWVICAQVAINCREKLVEMREHMLSTEGAERA